MFFLQDVASKKPAVYHPEYRSPSRRLYTAYLHVCKAVSSFNNPCQHARQLLRPTQNCLIASITTGWSSAIQCSHAACRNLWYTATAFIGFNTSLIIASVQFVLLAAAFMLKLATLAVQTCLMVFPLAIVLPPICLLGKVCWPSRRGLALIGPSTGSSGLNYQQQQTLFQASTSSIQYRRLQTTGQVSERRLQDATWPSIRQAVLDLLIFRLPESQTSCLICLEDIGISKMLHWKDAIIATARLVQPCICRPSLEITSTTSFSAPSHNAQPC